MLAGFLFFGCETPEDSFLWAPEVSPHTCPAHILQPPP